MTVYSSEQQVIAEWRIDGVPSERIENPHGYTSVMSGTGKKEKGIKSLCESL